MNRPALAVSVGGALLVVLVTTAYVREGSSGLSETPESVAQGSEAYNFDDLATMTVTAPLVVRAKVQAVTPGRKLMFGEDSKQYRAVQLMVEQVFFDRDQINPKSLVLEEEGWDRLGNGYIFEGLTWSQPGDEAIFWLDAPRDGYVHYFTSQGRVNLTTAGLQPTSAGPLGGAVANMTQEQLQGEMLSAVVRYKAGQLKPALPFGGLK